jgi:hypothetical protein
MASDVPKSSLRPINGTQMWIGALSLLIGGLVYLFDRPPEFTFFVHLFANRYGLYSFGPPVFGALGGCLPAFCHTFAFVLMTTGIVSCDKRGCLVIAMGWMLIDGTFELGQKFGHMISEAIPDGFSGFPLFHMVESYFRNGTFDYYDLAAVVLGSAAAFGVGLATMQRRRAYAT